YSRLPQPPRSLLFPYTTLFRSQAGAALAVRRDAEPGQRSHLRDRLQPPARSAGPRSAADALVSHAEDPSQRQPGQLLRRLGDARSEEYTSELQSPCNLVCRLLL